MSRKLFITSDVVLLHVRPQERDELCRARNGFVIKWSIFEGAPESVSAYETIGGALQDWYLFPRDGEYMGGRAPRGFIEARKEYGR